jgi:hypothetical protein
MVWAGRAWVGMPSAAAPALDRLSAAFLAAAACAACCCAWRSSLTAPASLTRLAAKWSAVGVVPDALVRAIFEGLRVSRRR